MNESDKLRVLIPHWIEHNEEHAGEFRRWLEAAGDDAREHVRAAADAMLRANSELAAALTALGGPLEGHHHHHHD